MAARVFSTLIPGVCALESPAFRITKQTMQTDTLAVTCLLIYIQKNGDE